MLELILIGHGNVARRFVALLREQRVVRARVVAIGTRHTLTVPTVDFIRRETAKRRAKARQRRLVVVETTTLSIGGRGEPAISHVRAALAGGAHVVSANKGPVAFAYRALARAAARARRRFLFEGAVMDGIPIFNLVRETLPGVRVLGFRGIVNTTTNYMLTAMEAGQSYESALADMQTAGIAEADPSLDVDGWDAAAKAAALANVLLGGEITPLDVDRRGITKSTGADAMAARRRGRRLKLVVEAAAVKGRVRARVAPAVLEPDDPLAAIDGRQNALILKTDLLEELAIVQRGGGLTQTAYALLADLATIDRDLKVSSARRRAPRARARRSR